MPTVTSKDGTKIAYDKVGSGPAVIFVNGAIAYRAFDPTLPQLAALLGEHFTVYNYDRRGRGESGDTRPFTKQREIEDIQALVEAAGGEAMLLGFSSGGIVSLDAAAATPGVVKVGVYEPPFIVDDTRQPLPADYAAHLMQLGIEEKREEAVEYFLIQAVGIPAEYIPGVKQDEASWSRMLAVAPTIAYDAAFVGDVMRGNPLPTDRWSNLTVPVLAMVGGNSDAWFHNGAENLVNILPNASRRTIPGQTHSFAPESLVPAIVEFFGS